MRGANLVGVAIISLVALASASAQAQTVYPDRVIKMIVPAPAGGQTDVMARLMAQKMQQSLVTYTSRYRRDTALL